MEQTGDLSGAMKILEESPQGARDITLHPSIADTLKALHPLPPPQPLWGSAAFPTHPPWDQSKVLILSGPSGLGKSSLAQALMPTALFCSSADQLKEFDPRRHEGIIFDDMNFLHWPRESQIHLVDFDFPRSIHLRYRNALIPKNTPKIFTTNLNPLGILNCADPAIRRRSTAWKISGSIGHLTYEVEW
jgi:hypothetical protein